MKTLENDVLKMLKEVEKLQALSDVTLNRQPQPGMWSVTQIMEHLNSYNSHYLPLMEQAMNTPVKKPVYKLPFMKAKAKAQEPQKIPYNPSFNSGFFGDRHIGDMRPKEGSRIARRQAAAEHTPKRIHDSHKVLADFIEGQKRMIECMKMATNSDLEKIKIPVTVSKWVKFRLGDTFRFLVAHQERHFHQLHTALKQVKATENLLKLVA